MKIRSKILSLIIIIIIAMSSAVIVYTGFNNFTSQLQLEKSTLQNYRNKMTDTHAELLRFLLDSYVIVQQLNTFNKSLEIKAEGFKELQKMTKLENLNPDIKKAFTNISNLENYQSESLVRFYSTTEDLLTAVKDVMGSDQNFILNSLSTTNGGLRTNQVAKLSYYIGKMKEDVSFLDSTMQASLNIIDSQYIIIDEQVNRFEQRGNFIAIGIFFFVVICSLLFGSSISGKIVNSIITIGSNLSVMAKGDLSHDIIVKTSDEIGVLSKDMNTFQFGLNESLNKIKRYSIKNEAIKEHLVKTAADASVASDLIYKNIDSVDNQLNTLNNNILQSNNQINQISSFTNDLNNHVSDQMAMVEESTASITQMIASISSVSNLTDKNMVVVEKLQDTAKDGDIQITETTDRISDINESVQKIGAMAEVIQSISEQTNLLAMNAAIEAAHAGDAGKGFAVVADEIRKLSEASAVSSKDIAQNLKDIVVKFDKASVSGVKTRDAFSNIYESIKSVSEALYAVSSSTSELNIGGTQILEAMDSLSNISTDVQRKSEDMNNSASMVKESIGEVSEISTIVTNAMAEVNSGFSEVRESITGLKDISSKVGNVSTDLNIEISKFVTRDTNIPTEESEDIPTDAS